MCGRTGANCGVLLAKRAPDTTGRTGLERGQEQPHRKAAGEKTRRIEGPPHFRIDSLKQKHRRIISFFHLPDTKYAAGVA